MFLQNANSKLIKKLSNLQCKINIINKLDKKRINNFQLSKFRKSFQSFYITRLNQNKSINLILLVGIYWWDILYRYCYTW